MHYCPMLGGLLFQEDEMKTLSELLAEMTEEKKDEFINGLLDMINGCPEGLINSEWCQFDTDEECN